MGVTLLCDQCGESFIKACRAAVMPHNFCTRKCCALWRKGKLLSIPPRVRLTGNANGFFRHGRNVNRTKVCEWCAMPFTAHEKSRFCSVACAAKWKMQKRWSGPDADMWRRRHSEMASGTNNTNYRDGRAKNHYASGWTQSLRRKIKERDGNACRSCGSPKNLTVHHRDETKTNHDPSNLITLCIRCHIRLHRGKLCLLP